MDNSAAMEAFRLRAMRRSPIPVPGVSPTGGGSNMQVPQGPQTPQAPRSPQGPQGPQAGASGGQSAGGAQQLGQSQPDEATFIVKALIQRLRSLTPKPMATA